MNESIFKGLLFSNLLFRGEVGINIDRVCRLRYS